MRDEGDIGICGNHLSLRAEDTIYNPMNNINVVSEKLIQTNNVRKPLYGLNSLNVLIRFLDLLVSPLMTINIFMTIS